MVYVNFAGRLFSLANEMPNFDVTEKMSGKKRKNLRKPYIYINFCKIKII